MLQSTANPYGLDYDDIHLVTDRLVVRSLQSFDSAQWLKVRHQNYTYLQEKEPIWDMDALTYQGFNRLVHDLQSSFQIGNYYSFPVFLKETGELVGGIEISNILYWPKQSASIGYWISELHSGKGFATELVKNITKWAFKTFNLVKIEAGTLESNIASQRVLRKSGFTQEGLSQSYGEINGIYQDHILWGLVQDNLPR